MASMLASFGLPETFERACYAAYSSDNGYVLQDCGNNALCVAFSGAVEASAFSQTDTEFGVCKINENNDYFVSAVDGTTRNEREAASVFKVVLIKFLAIWKDLEAQVAEALATGKNVVFTGHNIGGGMATLATLASLEKWGKGVPVYAITFGFPLIGDEILARAVRRQGWDNHFFNVVSSSDVFASTLLAPCMSVSAFLEELLPYWQRFVERMNGGDTDILMEPADVDFKRYILTVVHHASAVVKLTTVNNMEPAVNLSPYRPFGYYLFCSEKGAHFVENYEAVLPILFYSLACAQDEANISDHSDYGRVFHGNTSLVDLEGLQNRPLAQDKVSISDHTDYAKVFHGNRSMVNLEGLQNLPLAQGAALASPMEMQLDALGLGIQVSCSHIMASPESQPEQITCASQPEQITCASPPYQQRRHVGPEQGLDLGSPSTCVFKISDVLQLPSERVMPGISSSLKNKEINPTITPIRNLNPYQTRWLIRGRVTMKKEIHHFKTQHGDGKVFSFDIIDCQKTEVRITCFNKIVDLHYMNIQVGSIYTIEGGTVKTANKLYNKLNSQLEICLEDNSRVSLLDDDLSIPKHQFSFIPLDEIIHVANNCLVDVIGIVICVDPCTTIRRFDEKEVLRRSIQLIDLSSSTINVTLWGPTTQKEGSQLQEMYHLHQVVVLAIKNGKTIEYNGKIISTLGSTQLFINPDIEEATKLRIWFDHNGKDILSSSTHIVDVPLQIPRKTIVEIEEQTMNGFRTFQYIVKATIQFIKTNSIYYPSCPLRMNGKQCKKKVVKNADEMWTCAKCRRTFADCIYRYILQMKLADHTGTLWAVAFDEPATYLLSMSAQDLYMLQYNQEAKIDADTVIKQGCFKQYLFSISVLYDSSVGQGCLKSTVTKVDALNLEEEMLT